MLLSYRYIYFHTLCTQSHLLSFPPPLTFQIPPPFYPVFSSTVVRHLRVNYAATSGDLDFILCRHSFEAFLTQGNDNRYVTHVVSSHEKWDFGSYYCSGAEWKLYYSCILYSVQRGLAFSNLLQCALYSPTLVGSHALTSSFVFEPYAHRLCLKSLKFSFLSTLHKFL